MPANLILLSIRMIVADTVEQPIRSMPVELAMPPVILVGLFQPNCTCKKDVHDEDKAKVFPASRDGRL